MQWKIRHADSFGQMIEDTTKHGETVATVYGEDTTNARLIAAAPDMHSALDRIGGQAYDVDAYGEDELRERMREIARIAREAMAKAEGAK